MKRTPEQIMLQLVQTDRVWLFLDYDGTLADFAPTPEFVEPDPAVVSTLDRLVRYPSFRIAVISGRALNQVRQLVPVADIWLAGTYGIEVQLPDGTRIQRADQRATRPDLERLKPIWQQLIAHRAGFFLEDKGWTLALHARFASDDEAEEVLSAAEVTAIDLAASNEFCVRQGQRFLEVGATQANKGRSVEFILDRWAWSGALPVYVGDDANDEVAFEVIKDHQGLALLVAESDRSTLADARLASPRHTLGWLNAIADYFYLS